MAVKKKDKVVRKQRRHIPKTWPVDERTPSQVLSEHRLIAIHYVETRYYHG